MRPVLFGAGSIRRMKTVLDGHRASRVFLVTGRHSFEASGAQRALQPALAGRSVHRYCGFTENPKLEQVERGIDELRAQPCDAVVAVGGGTALDMGKLVNLLAMQESSPGQIVRGDAPVVRRGLPLVAVPTTAGSGSEATHFGVVYADRIKYSLASPFLLPDVAVVDPDLTMSASPRQTAVSGMDAFAQAVESYWSIHSTEASQGYARRAIQLVLGHLACAVTAPDRRHRRAMSKAAHLAGRAINITKTTAAHAVSYPLTSHYGVPHGHAVGLTLGEFLLYNSGVSDDDVADPRGAEHVREAIDDIVRLMGCESAEGGRQRIRSLMRTVGLATDLGSLGIRDENALELVVRHANVERMVNNPRTLDAHRLGGILDAIR